MATTTTEKGKFYIHTTHTKATHIYAYIKVQGSFNCHFTTQGGKKSFSPFMLHKQNLYTDNYIRNQQDQIKILKIK